MEWVLRDPTRFLRERAAFERLVQEVDWLTALAWRLDAGLVVEIDLDLESTGTHTRRRSPIPICFRKRPRTFGLATRRSSGRTISTALVALSAWNGAQTIGTAA